MLKHTFWIASLFATVGISASGACLASSEVAITVRGDVPAQCAIATTTAADLSAGQPSFGVLDIGGQLTVSAGMSCNSPFRLSVKSENGALVNSALTPTSGDFTKSVPYTIDWAVGLDSGGTLATTGCRSGDMLAGAGCEASSPDSAILKNLAATVRWTGAPVNTPLLAGVFADVVTIRLTPVGW